MSAKPKQGSCVYIPAELLAGLLVQLVPVGQILASLNLLVRVKVLNELVHQANTGNLVAH